MPQSSRRFRERKNEAMRRARAMESDEARAARLARDAKREARRRAAETDEERAARLAANTGREARRRARAMESDEARAARLARDATREARRRAEEIPQQREDRQKKFDEQMFESPLIEGKRKRTLKAPTVFFHIKCHKTRKSLKKKSANKITTHNFVKNRPILPKPSYCAAPPADSSSREPDCVKNCGDKMEGFEILQIKVEDLQSDGFEELAREPERATIHLKLELVAKSSCCQQNYISPHLPSNRSCEGPL
uniref:Uncharacterized protein n=1 Tax=Eptatretus burgeri TaxID=7764 RepID=A0A8C4QE72_EPTBU